jgi:adhesin/invasin
MKINRFDKLRSAGRRKMLLQRTILAAQIALQVVMPLYAWLPGIATAVENNKPVNGTLVRLDEVGEQAKHRSPFKIDREKNALQSSGSSSSGSLSILEQLPDIGSNQEHHGKPTDTSVLEKQQFDQMTDDWGTAARIAASDDSMTAARGFAIGGATGYADGEVQKWLQQFGTAKVNLNVDDSMNFEDSSLDFLYPVYDSPSRLFFTQAGGRYSDERWMANFGVGQRHFLGSWMVGYNLFFDQDLTEDHSRGGTGLEFWRDNLKLSANGYYRITGWKDSSQIDYHQARPANGFDMKVEGYLPAYPQLGGSVGYEKYYGNDVALFGHDNDRQKNPSALSYGFTYTPVPFVEFDTTYKDGQDGQSDTQFGLQFNYALGVPFSEQFDPDGVAIKRSLAGSRYDLVERNNTIVLDYRNNGKIRLSLPSTLSGQGNTTVNLQASVQSDNGLDHISWDDAALRAAGGSLIGSGASYTVHLPSYMPGSVNTYMLSGIAYDKEGHSSSSASTALSVLASAIDPTNAQVNVSPSTLNADGTSTSTLTIVLQDERGNALTSQASGFTFNLSGSATQQVVSSLRRVVTEYKAAKIGTVKEVSPGKYQAMITAGTTAGSLIVTPYLNGTTLPTATLTLTADSSDVSLKSESLQLVLNNSRADGTTQNQAKVTVVDQNNNPVSNVGVNWSLPSGNTTAKLSSTSSVTGDDGIAYIYITDMTAETISLTASVNNSTLSTDVTFTQSNDGAVIQANSLTVKDANTIADGKTTKTATVKVVDGSNDPLTGIQVGWVVDGTALFAGGSDSSSSATASDGTATITLTDTKAETIKVTATVNGKSQSVSSSFVADNSNPTLQSGSFVVTKDGSTADGKASNQAQVSVVDAQGNPVSDVSVSWSLPSGNTTAVLSGTSSTTDANGIATVNVTDKAAETIQITATLGSNTLSGSMGFTQDNDSAVVQADSLSVVDASTPADGVTMKTASVVVVDGNNSPLNGIQVTWSVNGSAVFSNSSPTATTASDSEGKASITLTDAKAETVTVTATVNNQSQRTTSVYVADSANAVVKRVQVTSDNNIADGSSQNSAVAIILDANNNPVPNANVAWNSGSSTITFDQGSHQTQTNQYGIATIKYADTTAGSQTLTATLDNGQTGSANTTFAVNPANIKVDSIELVSPANGTKVINDGSSAYTYKAKIVDDNDNVVSGMGVTWSLSGNAKFVGGTSQSTTGTDGYAQISFTDTSAETVTLTATLANGSKKDTGNTIAFLGHYSITAQSVSSGWATDDTTFSNANEYATVTASVIDNTTGKSAGSSVAVTAIPDSGTIVNSSSVATNNGTATFKFASTTAKTHSIKFSVVGDSSSDSTGDAIIVASPTWPQIEESITVKDDHSGDSQYDCDVSTTVVTKDKWGNAYTSEIAPLTVQYVWAGGTYTGSTATDADLTGFVKPDGGQTQSTQSVTLQWDGNKLSGDQKMCAKWTKVMQLEGYTTTPYINYNIHAPSPLTTILGGSATFDLNYDPPVIHQ